jgi:endogenous inhibitor of DNA gyrase (YacG/DUF329 family)
MTCPICNKPVDESGRAQPGSTFPFCSDRCRLIDLGRWLSGKYQIPSTADEDCRDTSRGEAEREATD